MVLEKVTDGIRIVELLLEVENTLSSLIWRLLMNPQLWHLADGV